MRIPFIPKSEDPYTLIKPEREDFIQSTKGGSPFISLIIALLKIPDSQRVVELYRKVNPAVPGVAA